MADIFGVLTNPNAFFSEKMQESIDLKIPSLIVFIVALISGVSGYIMTNAVFINIPEAASFASVAAIGGAIGAFVTVFIMWLIYTAIFHGISALLGGKGSFKRSLEVVGYGYIPTIFSSIVGIVGMQSLIGNLQNINIEDSAAYAEIVAADPVLQAVSVVGMIFMLWSANIWIFGIKHARSLSTKNAVITVGAPVALYLIYSVLQVGVI
ncbi:YIP1 family protein [Methanohalophilus sp.]|uniref:YIP1 family protein n=1 Tax=Methanohalophilus sp. TaxID=1966352 RepID=UPI0026247D49|nr:YIP1 family protein [Methanohalophilus sp.]MDK2892208.1 hypothetical protein [Methanohalophilus sp.]